MDRRARRWSLLALMPGLGVLAALALVAVWAAAPRGRPAVAADWAALRATLTRGEGPALARARQLVVADWDQARPHVAVLLQDPAWPARAAACALLAERLPAGAEEAVPLLVARASDADWQVRAAAFDALARLRPLSAPVLRDTPMDQRETILLAWLAEYDRTARVALLPELCELYAQPVAVEFGRPLVARCLTCHVGVAPAPPPRPPPPEGAAACADCHPAIAQQWERSAHAQSLTHLRLRTVNPATRQVETMDFGLAPRHGISCTECHRLAPGGAGGAGVSAAAAPPVGVAASAPGRAACAFTFAGPATPQACARCHADTQRQWQTWQRQPHPAPADWPPGQIDWQARDDPRTCVDCHMTISTIDQDHPARDHRWAARRDLAFLQQGLDVQVERHADGDAAHVQLVLSNLAGHAYPTGSRRRALAIYAGSADDPPRPALAVLSPQRPGAVIGGLPALAPAERRVLTLPWPRPDAALAYRLVYERDHHDPQALRADVFDRRHTFSPWLAPR